MKLFFFLSLCFLPLLAYAQDAALTDATLSNATPGLPRIVEARFEVQSSREMPLEDGSGRKVTMQRVKPLVLPPPVAAPPPSPEDLVVLAARRAAWAMVAKKERRLLSLTGIYYPNGQTFLQWFMPDPAGKWTTYEAWTLADCRGAWLVQDFEVGNTIYDVFPMIHPARKGDSSRNMPGPLWFPVDSPGFRLTKGDPAYAKALEPIAALVQILQKDAPGLTAQWLALQAANEAEAARLKANPPPVEDIVIKITLLKSNLHPEAEAEANAALAAGRSLASPAR